MDLFGLVLPRRCAVCRLTGVDLCERCYTGLKRLTGPLCARCGAPTAWPVSRCRECSGRRLAFGSARAAVAYDRAATLLVAAWKEQSLRALASAAADIVAEVLPPPRGALTFVPPDGDRWLKRGHHPAERLAEELSRRWDLPVTKMLVRAGRSRRQRGLPLAERRRNVAGAFRAREGDVPASVVLVDDVYTTGSTAAAAASALRKGGARTVDVVALARAVRGLR